MKSITAAFLSAIFAGLCVIVGGERLYGWYETGRLAMTRKMSGGPDVITYASDPIQFLMEFELNLFLMTIGTVGALVACRDFLLKVSDTEAYFDLRPADEYIKIFYRLLLLLFVAGLLIIPAFGLLQRFV